MNNMLLFLNKLTKNITNSNLLFLKCKTKLSFVKVSQLSNMLNFIFTIYTKNGFYDISTYGKFSACH